MNYQIEFCPNKDVIQIHVNQRLIQGSILCFDCYESSSHTQKEFEEQAINKDGLVSFCKAVSELDGMEEDVSVHRYDIQLMKASALFPWDDILPHILNALQTFIANDQKLEEAVPPKYPTEEELKALREQGCWV